MKHGDDDDDEEHITRYTCWYLLYMHLSATFISWGSVTLFTKSTQKAPSWLPTLQETNISPTSQHFWVDDVPFSHGGIWYMLVFFWRVAIFKCQLLDLQVIEAGFPFKGMLLFLKFFNKAKTCSFQRFTFGWRCCIMKRLESFQDFVLLCLLLCFSRNMSRRVLGVADLSNNSWHYLLLFNGWLFTNPLSIVDEAFFSPTAADHRGRVTEMFRATARTRGQVLWEIHVPQQKQRQPLQIWGAGGSFRMCECFEIE